jgi:hypothetical protein
MVSLVVGESSFLVSTPIGCAAVICVFETYYVVYVDEVTGFVGVEAYGGIWLIALEVEAVTIVATRNYS